MKDLLIMTADSTMTQVLRAFFKREAFAHSLGCDPFTIDVQKDILNTPGFTDGGLHTRAHEIMRPFLGQYRNALVILDKQFGGERPASEVQQEIENNLRGNGWNGNLHNAAVIVIDPELEVWLWQDNVHVEKALGAQSGLRQKLESDGVWPAGQAKPHQPKETMQETIIANHAGTYTPAYCRIASTVSVSRCSDPSFIRFRDQLRTWFPKQGAHHAT